MGQLKNRTRQEGQVVLITLLVLTIATTVALSLISRTTTDVTITNQVEESSRAFSAAEAGIEEALRSGIGTSGAQTLAGGRATYNVTVSSIGDAAGMFEFPKKIQEGTTETLWLVSHDANGVPIETPTYTSPTIGICWSSETVPPALVATVLYKESSDNSYRVTKAAFDPNGVRATSNKFVSTYEPGGCSGTGATGYRETIDFTVLTPSLDPTTDTLISLRIRPVYSDATIAIDSGAAVLPVQGNRIESTGSTTSGTNRKIVVFQQYRSPATMFDAALYSQGTLIQ